MRLTLAAWQVRWLRLLAQRLDRFALGRPAAPESALRAMIGAQAQELPAALLSIRARSRGLTAALLETARQRERSLAWTWLMRGTLHLVTAEDARWLLPLLGPRFIEAGRGRMKQLGWDEERTRAGLRLVERALNKRASLTRAEIAALLAENGLPHAGQAPVHLIYRAALGGILTGGPDAGGDHAYVSVERWLGGLSPLPRGEALARIALRYLAAFGPAAPRDLAAWSGLSLTEARQGWAQIADPVEEVQLSDPPEGAPGSLWLLKSQRYWIDDLVDRDLAPLVCLLPRYDTLWMGYASRDLLVDRAVARHVNAGGGIIHPMLLVNGQVRGTWKTLRKNGALEIHIAPFALLEDAVLPGLQDEVDGLALFLETETRLVVHLPGA